jgi:hypothetical protein
MYFYQKGEFVTHDYGQTWQKIYNKNAECLGILDDRFIFYTYQEAFTYNPSTHQLDSLEYLPYCAGNVDVTAFENGVAFRMMYAQDGQEQGYSTFPSNYASINIDEMPLGNQRAIHFPQRAALIDIEVTDNCIHLVLDGRYTRSCDGGSTFYDVDAFNGNMNEQVMFIDFVNDTLGFLVSKNLITYEWRVWKTTNGGGANLAPVLTNQFYAGMDELKGENNVEIYPNPTSDKITIQSESTLNKIELYSVLGDKIQEYLALDKDMEIDMSNYQSGVYFVRVYTENGFSEKKVVLSK